MKNQEKQPSEEISNKQVREIGMNKYKHLKSFPVDQLTEEQKIQISKFELKNSISDESKIKVAEYFKSILTENEEVKIEFTALDLFKAFKIHFSKIAKKEFTISDQVIQDISPLIYYFSKDKRFFDCENLSDISKPDFNKGLLIIGDYGNGKSTSMRTLESVFRLMKDYCFSGYTTNEVVLMFEKCTGDNAQILRDEFNKKMCRGKRYFDDLKAERIASNFGKVNIIKEILEERYDKKIITFGTCNYDENYPKDLEKALEEFGSKYGLRVYDRIFEMFNIVEFKGKSFRK